MTYINENYLKLTAGYLFPEIGRRVKKFCERKPFRKGHSVGHRRRHRTSCPRRDPGDACGRR